MTYVVVSSDGELTGPFDTPEQAAEWAAENEDMVGDWHVKEMYPAT